MMYRPRSGIESMQLKLATILKREIASYEEGQKFVTLDEFLYNEDSRGLRKGELKSRFSQVKDEDVGTYVQLLRENYESDENIKALIDSVLTKA
jgi:hypothetical protein